MSSTLSEQRKFITPLPGEDWNALATRALPGESVESAIQSLKSWNLHFLARVPSGDFLGCDVVFVEPPRGVVASLGEKVDRPPTGSSRGA